MDWYSPKHVERILKNKFAIATQQQDVSAHTKYDIELIKRWLLKMDWYSPKLVEYILKNTV